MKAPSRRTPDHPSEFPSAAHVSWRWPEVPSNRNQGSTDRRFSSHTRHFVQSKPGTSAFRTSFGTTPNPAHRARRRRSRLRISCHPPASFQPASAGPAPTATGPHFDHQEPRSTQLTRRLVRPSRLSDRASTVIRRRRRGRGGGAGRAGVGATTEMPIIELPLLLTCHLKAIRKTGLAILHESREPAVNGVRLPSGEGEGGCRALQGVILQRVQPVDQLG